MQNLKEFANEKPISAEEMHAIELNCSSLGISTAQLMENAGSAVANFIKEILKKGSILFFCGTGNNGGDGFVAARMLSKDYNVEIIIVGDKEIKQGPALSNFHAISKSPFIKIHYYTDLDKEEVNSIIKKSDLIVDAIFGTGFRGELKGIYKDAVLAINNSGKKVVAIDVPSGFSKESKLYVRANYTITFHRIKEGMGALRNVIVKDIGIPIDAELFAWPGDLYLASKPISIYASKRERGMLVIIGGSRVYHGAPIHALLSASSIASLRTGAGYTVLYVPNAILDVVRKLSQNQIVRPAGEDHISFTDELKRDIDKAQAIVIGMGITKEKQAQDACQKIVSYALSNGKKAVVDADGISAIAGMLGVKRIYATNLLITPHDSEFYQFSGIKLKHEDSNIFDRVEAAKKVAKEKGINILLKGHNTIITNGEKTKINMANTANLSTMGTGDVLSGIIGAFAAMGNDLFEAAVAGAYLHSKAGEVLAMEKGNHIIASDLIDKIPKIMSEFDKVLQ
ncbi:MAG: NAD(P)H-hydrate dehydratase [Candidatus Micrarchaeota archaeon]